MCECSLQKNQNFISRKDLFAQILVTRENVVIEFEGNVAKLQSAEGNDKRVATENGFAFECIKDQIY